ncbi:hypothetical protein [Sorangium sp. So ce1000]|uniref:hypothetical protein n=1 Tax=Sorangium sp. So ce1000 TaxID=3133325 RepID=UPI003F5FF7BF
MARQDPWRFIAVIGATRLVDARRTDGPVTRKVLGMGSAGALAAIDLISTSAGRIPKVSLLELGIVGAWTWFSD